MPEIKTDPLRCRAFDGFADKPAIFRVRSAYHQIDRRLRRRIVFKYSKGFSGPVDFARRSAPAETTGATQTLRLCQVSLAPSQRVLGPLTFGFFCGFPQRTLHR